MRQIGADWTMMNQFGRPWGFRRRRHADLLARQGSNGVLWLYPGYRDGRLVANWQVGAGWAGANAILAFS
jgi:hypothetical protein